MRWVPLPVAVPQVPISPAQFSSGDDAHPVAGELRDDHPCFDMPGYRIPDDVVYLDNCLSKAGKLSYVLFV